MLQIAALLFTIACSMQALFAEIQRVDHLNPIVEAAANFTEKSLVVLDVDRMIIEPQDAILRAPNQKLLQQLRYKYGMHMNVKKIENLTSIVYLQGKSQLIEPQIASFIADLQKRKIPVIALTATQVRGVGHIPSIPEWRINDLKSHGIYFGTSFPETAPFVLSEITGQGSSPVYKEGILFSATYSKGAVLDAFLNRLRFSPDKVLFADDQMYNVTSVHEAMENRDTPEIFAFEYTGAENLPNTLDLELADLQFKMLIEKEIWMSQNELEAHQQQLKVEAVSQTTQAISGTVSGSGT